MSNGNRSTEFFDTQFRRQVDAGDFALNDFERMVLPHLRGDVLDLGCGLGNLTIAAARAGCRVTAMDASMTAIRRILDVAAAEQLVVSAVSTDLANYHIDTDFDCIVSIGLLMFFPEEQLRRHLADIRARVRPGGVAAVNLLTAGTTFMDMFEPGHFTLLPPGVLRSAFDGWTILMATHHSYAAPHATHKLFDTVIAVRG